MTMYKNQAGDEMKVENMNSNHLLNSFAKNIRQQAGGFPDLEEPEKVLKDEIFRRIELGADKK